MTGFRKDKNKAGVYAYLNTPTNTSTPVTPDEFTAISGVFVNNPIQGFILDTDKLKKLEEVVMDLLQSVTNLEENAYLKSNENNSFNHHEELYSCRKELSKVIVEKNLWENRYYTLRKQILELSNKLENPLSDYEN